MTFTAGAITESYRVVIGAREARITAAPAATYLDSTLPSLVRFKQYASKVIDIDEDDEKDASRSEKNWVF